MVQDSRILGLGMVLAACTQKLGAEMGIPRDCSDSSKGSKMDHHKEKVRSGKKSWYGQIRRDSGVEKTAVNVSDDALC